MATRTADSEAIVQRCRNAGWTVIDVPDGWKVYPRNQEESAGVIHRTPSDVRGFRQIVSQLERKGLKEDEAAAKADAAAERKRKIAADRAANDKRAAAAAATAATQQALISKAAGPYLVEPEDCDIEWMTQPHPAPWMRWMYVTPKAAKYVLKHHNTDNRAISESTVNDYKLRYLAGDWRLTHQGIAFDTRGILQDGQHRKEALAALLDLDGLIDLPFDINKGLAFPVFVGMPVENFKKIDEHRIRTARQMLAKAGIANAGHATTCLRAIAAYESGNPGAYHRRTKLTVSAAFDGIGVDQERIEAAVKYGSRQYRLTDVPPGTFAAAYYLICQVNGFDNPYVGAFFEGFIRDQKYNTDRVLPDDDPRKVLRKRVAANSRRNRAKTTRPATPVEIVEWFIRSWNNLVEGRHPSYIKPAAGNVATKILLCVPGEGAAPRALLGEV